MRVLVLGASGMLGHAACRTFSRRFEVWTASRTRLDADPRLWSFLGRPHCRSEIDCTLHGVVERLLDECRPRVVLNCLGIVKQRPEAEDPELAIAVNALFPHRLARACNERGAKLLHVSTDCVFSGRRGLYTESDIPDPVDLYGKSKLLGEVVAPPHLTIRTSMIGRQLFGEHSLLEWLRSRKGGEVEGFTRAVFSGLTTLELARVIAELIEMNERSPGPSGLYHVASEPISKYDLIARLNERLDLGIRVQPSDTLRCDRSLDGSRFARETGIEVSPWNEMLSRLAEDEASYTFLRPAVKS
jgi:dTDP-4-dehydrorhamnose reductase